MMVLICSSLQSSLLHWIFNWHATFQLAITIAVYVILNRGQVESLIFTYLAFYCMAALSNMFEGVAVLTGVTLYLGLRTIRTRIYSPTPTHFTWAALSSIFLFHFLSWIFTVGLELNVPRAHPLVWVLEILITALGIKPLYHLLQWIDQKTNRVTVSEIIL
ncbi:MAG: hypothetical protein IT289_04630 [Oligoflexia bacterium]|nr:hypothetical protein [Oligoflexia bacterium]